MLTRPPARRRRDYSEHRDTGSRSAALAVSPDRPHIDRAPSFASPYSIFVDVAAKVVTDEKGQVIWASSAAAAAACDSTCITIENGELGGRTRYSSNVLKEIFCDLRESDRLVDQFLAASTEDRPEVFLRAQSRSSQGVRINSFTIRRLDREMREIPDLRRLYGLTKTEELIVRAMLRGRSAAEIAVEFHKSALTVRTHVKRIYTKLNVGTKEQLFSTVMKLMID